MVIAANGNSARYVHCLSFWHISTVTAAIFARCMSFLGLTASGNGDLLMFALHVCHASTDNWVFCYPLFWVAAYANGARYVIACLFLAC